MAYNLSLAEQVRELLQTKAPIKETKMFGGIAFMYNGNMVLGVMQDDLIVRVGLAKYEHALSQPGAELFAATGKPMAGWVSIKPQGYQDTNDLDKWIDQALDFVKTLPAK